MLEDKSKRLILTEKELISGSLNNDLKCQKVLFDKYKDTMKSLCFRYAGNNQDAEDIMQEGFILAFTKLKHYKFEGSFEGWLRRIMTNVALKFLKREKRIYFEKIDSFTYIKDKSEDVLSKLNANDLFDLLTKLPTGYRTVFNMYVIEGFSHKEIGKKLSIAESSSRSQLVKAKKMLKKLITELYSDNG